MDLRKMLRWSTIATMPFIFVCLMAGCSGGNKNAGANAAAAKPKPILLCYADRSGSVTEAKGTTPEERLQYHSGAIKIAMDALEYSGNFYAEVNVFGRQMGTAYEGRPEDWEAVGPSIAQYIQSGEAMSGRGTYVIPVLADIQEQAKINPDSPIFVLILSDGLFNDLFDKLNDTKENRQARLRLKRMVQKVYDLKNVEVLILGPVTPDAVKRRVISAAFLPSAQPVDRVMLRGELDFEQALRQSLTTFKAKHIPEE